MPESIVEGGARRRYQDACAVAHGLDLIGERWALLVMRELMFGPRRFSDLRTALPGISANVLTQRLDGLEAAGLLHRRRLPPPAAAQVYELTEWGYEIEPVLRALGRWAARSPGHDPSLPISTVSLLLSLRTMFSPERAAGVAGRIAFRIGAERYLCTIAAGRITVAPEAQGAADLELEAAPAIIAALVYGGQPADALEAQGLLRVEGDRALLARFPDLFPLPPKAAP